ncbi:hypothetical protein BGZ63DRAFT_41966 [Mariannaea sp. PMI_226]|nr:hypothetical protein BGZ63DRAFT_41966 [Mariannaea sp. PMI_226]
MLHGKAVKQKCQLVIRPCFAGRIVIVVCGGGGGFFFFGLFSTVLILIDEVNKSKPPPGQVHGKPPNASFVLCFFFPPFPFLVLVLVVALYIPASLILINRFCPILLLVGFAAPPLSWVAFALRRCVGVASRNYLAEKDRLTRISPSFALFRIRIKVHWTTWCLCTLLPEYILIVVEPRSVAGWPPVRPFCPTPAATFDQLRKPPSS